MLESSLCQVLPRRNSPGSVILFITTSYLPLFHRKPQSLPQMNYFLYMTVAEDETNQTHGVVAVSYDLAQGEPEANTTPQLQYSTWDNTLMAICILL
jgi:hypothetical protein